MCLKDTIRCKNKWPAQWEKILVNYVFDNSLVSTMYKELSQPNYKETNDPVKNGPSIW